MQQPLSPSQRVAYLANVLSIAKPENSMLDTERAILQEAVDRIDADSADVHKARLMVSRQPYSMRRMRSSAVKRNNIEDMVAMALADGELTRNETSPIEKLTDLLGFSQADLDMLVRRAETRLRKIRNAQSRSARKAPPPIPEAPIETSPPAVAKPAEPQEIAPPEELPPPPAPRPHEPPEPVQAKRTEARPIQTKPVKPHRKQQPKPEAPAPKSPPVTAEKAAPEKESDLSRCRKCRADSSRPNEYCFGLGSDKVNPWGCRLLNMPWSQDAEWLRLGQFREDNSFILDRRAIRSQLTERMKETDKCPHFSRHFAESVLDRLPSRANVRGHWRYRKVARYDQGAKRLSTVSYVHGQQISTKETVSGLVPDGIDNAVKLILMAAREVNADVDTKAIREHFASSRSS